MDYIKLKRIRNLIIILLVFFIMPSKAQQTAVPDSIARSLNLDSLVVKGHRPTVKLDGSVQTVTVKGSFLSRMGSLGDMFAVTPGFVQTGHNSFSVLGKGTPVYYVDGREVTGQDIFSTLKSSNIDKIEIDTEPSAKYPAGTSAVVNIKTIKPLRDYISLNIYNSLGIRRKVTENPSIIFKMKNGIWNTSLSYDYSAWNNLNKETYFSEIYGDDGQCKFRSDTYNRDYSGTFDHTVNWANDLYVAKNHRISFIYYFKHRLDKEESDEEVAYTGINHYADRTINIRPRSNRNTHNFTLSYTGSTGKNSTVNVSGDYSLINDNGTTNSFETNKETLAKTHIYTNSKNKYNVLTLNGSYTFLLPWNLTTQIGGRYYNVANTTNQDTDNPRFANDYAVNRQHTRDNVSAGYLMLSKRLGKFGFTIGGRYEYSDTRITVNTASNAYTAHRHTSDFMPSVMAYCYPTKDFVIQLNYNRSMGRPGYAGLNPYPTYQDTLTYSRGNIDLTSSRTDNVSLILTYKSMMQLKVGYTYAKNSILNVQYCDDPSTDIISEFPINYPESKSWWLNFLFSKNFNRFYFGASIFVTLPRDKFEFLGKVYDNNKLQSSGQISINYRFSDKFYAFTSLTYQSRNNSMNEIQRPASNWTLGVQAHLLKDRLSVSLSATDILHNANYNNIDMYYLNTKNGTYGTNDQRGITLSVSLNLFNRNINVKASRNNGEVMDRTM